MIGNETETPAAQFGTRGQRPFVASMPGTDAPLLRALAAERNEMWGSAARPSAVSRAWTRLMDAAAACADGWDSTAAVTGAADKGSGSAEGTRSTRAPGRPTAPA